ncbi:MAG: hypothetical protein LQ340_000610 [Diploschistes diacapsis]|nr:MAG: hypothetical protein LQ340_000610 [Diploschistes diacapsis]
MAYNEAKGIRRGKYTMTVEDITAIFEPVVQDIIGLVLGQIRALKGSASKMLMVGGLGQSSYLRERIREAVPDVEVLQPGNGWSAVARGALIRGIELLMSGSASVSVGGRMARKHYGRRIWAKFDPALHEKHRK